MKMLVTKRFVKKRNFKKYFCTNILQLENILILVFCNMFQDLFEINKLWMFVKCASLIADI